MHEEPIGKKNLAYKPLFIERLQKLKVENDTTSEQLANFLEMPLEYYINNVEMPDKYISWFIVYRIANYFNIQQDYLYGYTNHPNDEFYDTDIYIYLSEQVKKLERIKGYPDEEEIAHHLEISEDEYYDIRNGKGTKEPSLYVIANLANYLNVSLDYLVGRSDDPTRL